MASKFPKWCDIGPMTKPFVCLDTLPELGLVADLWFELRVYVLKLEGGRLYVGITHKSDLVRRLSEHFTNPQCWYTKKYRAKSVVMCWPAAHRGVEAYVFQAMLSRLDKCNIANHIGGWIQPYTKLTPLQGMVFEEQRRSVREDCFRCGGGHMVSKCRAARSNLFCTYTCPNPKCRTTIDITPVGKTQEPEPSKATAVASGAASSSSSNAASSQDPTPARGTKRTIEEVAPVTRAARAVAKAKAKATAGSMRFGLAVRVCGVRYTAVSWYLNTTKPHDKLCTKVRTECRDAALEICNGDARTLALGGFAAHTLAGAKPLLLNREGKERQLLPAEYTATECTCVANGDAVEVRVPGRTYGKKRMNQLLFRVDALQRVLKGNWVL